MGTQAMTDYSELERLAKDATPGPWDWGHEMQPSSEEWTLNPGILIAEGTDGTPEGDSIDRANAAFIAAANPATVLALLSELSQSKAREERMREALEFYADPETWFGFYTTADSPINSDWSDDLPSQYEGIFPDGKPGSEARQALKETNQ